MRITNEMNNTNELDPDFINNLDNISLTETNDLSTGKINTQLAYTKTNAFTLKTVFGKYVEFGKDDEDDLIFSIQDGKNIDWNEVSMSPKLPEFIMKEFQDKLNWNLVVFNRRMVSTTIEYFEKRLFNVTNSDDFISKLNDSNTFVLNIILITNKKLISNIFAHACTNNYIKWVSVLEKNPNIGPHNISNGFNIACRHNCGAIVKILIDNPAITPDDIMKGFTDACQHNHEAIVKIFIDHPTITSDSIMQGFKTACRYNRVSIAKILIYHPAITSEDIDEILLIACRNNRESIVKILIDRPAVTPENIYEIFLIACQNNWKSIVETLIDNPAITAAVISLGIMSACRNNRESIVKILINHPEITHMNILIGFEIACQKNFISTVKTLIDHPAVTYYKLNRYKEGPSSFSRLSTIMRALLNTKLNELDRAYRDELN